MIAIIDYGCGNILSLKRALDEIGLKNKVTSSQEEIHNSNSFENVNCCKVWV